MRVVAAGKVLFWGSWLAVYAGVLIWVYGGPATVALVLWGMGTALQFWVGLRYLIRLALSLA